MTARISLRVATAFRLALAASWLVLAAPGFAATTDFDEGFTSYLSGNYTRAFILWLPLAEAGEIEAQFGLGLLYERGRGVLRDIEAAASWYARAAEQGSMRAQTQLGGMYARGDGVPEDWSRAIAWWRRAEAQGSMRAMFHLGLAYQYGSGVERDMARAILWYGQAAALGFRLAARQIEEIERLRGEEAAALAATDPTAEPEADGSDGVIVALANSSSSSVFHETADDLKIHDSTLLIALDADSTQPLERAHRIYLASYRSIQTASEGWRGMSASNAALLGNLYAAVSQINLGREKGIVYRLQAGPLSDVEQANALCYKLSQRDIHCVVVSP